MAKISGKERPGGAESEEKLSSAQAGLKLPQTPAELHEFVVGTLGLRISRRGLIGTAGVEGMGEGHAAPFEYLVHTFFEGRLGPDGSVRDLRAPLDCVVWASRGGGKTLLGAVATLLDLLFKDGIEVRILGGSLEQSQRMAEHLRRLAELEAIAPMVNKVTEKSLSLRNGSRAMVMTHSQASVRGTRAQKVRCDEVELFDPPVWEAVQLTTRSLERKGPWGEVVRGAVEALSTMHRPMGLMWELAESAGAGVSVPEGEEPGAKPAKPTRSLFRWGVLDVLERCGDEHACAGCSLWTPCAGRAKKPEHEAGHVRVGDALLQRARVSRAVWEAEMLCLRPSRGGTVLPEFDVRRHVYGKRRTHETDALLPEGKWVAGMDFGFRAPTVILWAHLGGDGVLRVLHEYVERERTMQEHIAVLTDPDRPRPEFIAVDPAGAQSNDQTGSTNVQLLGAAGLSVKFRSSAILEGIMAIRRRLEGAAATPEDPSPAARLLVHARCKKLIMAMQRYHYPEEDPECEAPVKDGHDHLVDALRYLVLNLDAPTRSKCSLRG